ncbi:helix-turn-helix domain-containing protein [candidate division WWE3 bacterium]|uniref:Helix-turn-helix domain-containing protein n=1 Tax=candidate division WWE3 bacterium TaxID=2053526 RepID=A0A7X9HT80_UNCKA|nr:helix-turn-helix domain-containing protein [candidate division WWE3 bacterium]
MIKLENKLYSSTEVAAILGVSLRSVYRYLEEGKLNAEVKTATGRHRFTRQNIIDFLYPTGVPEGEVVLEQPAEVLVKKTVKVTEPAVEESVETKEEVKTEVEEVEIKEPEVEEKVITPKVEIKEEKINIEKEEEQVDWLAKFREAAKKFEEKATEEVTGLGAVEEEIPVVEEGRMFFYRSRLGGLKDIAQNIDKTSRNSGLDYAFTLNAGLSLYRPINPFSLLHVYIRSKDKDFFERILALTPSDESNAQLCIITSDEDSLYKESDEMHGLRVVEKNKLVEDISKMDEDLLKEAESILK